MDIFEKHGIKIPSAVLIREATNTETDDEVLDFLKQYGSISNYERIDEPDSAFYRSIVVEYHLGAALVALRPVLPYIYLCAEVKVSHEIVELSAVCAEKVGALHIETYLCELQKVARLTGQDFIVVLNGAISQLGQTVTELHPIATRAESPSEDMSSELPRAATVHLKASPLSAAVIPLLR